MLLRHHATADKGTRYLTVVGPQPCVNTKKCLSWEGPKILQSPLISLSLLPASCEGTPTVTLPLLTLWTMKVTTPLAPTVAWQATSQGPAPTTLRLKQLSATEWPTDVLMSLQCRQNHLCVHWQPERLQTDLVRKGAFTAPTLHLFGNQTDRKSERDVYL